MEPKTILVVVVAVVMLWFAMGVIYNIRRGERLLRWAQGGLPLVGERTTFRWLGSSVAELVIAQGKGAIRRLELLVVLAPRDLVWNWVIAFLRGRKDILILRLDLAGPPRLAFDLADPQTWTGRMILQDARGREWQIQEYQGQELAAASGHHKLAASQLERLHEPLARLSPRFARISLRRETPHLELHLPFPDTPGSRADEFFTALQALARKANQSD